MSDLTYIPFNSNIQSSLHLNKESIKILENDVKRITKRLVTFSDKSIRAYTRFISRSLEKAYKDQLNHQVYGTSGVGFAFGSLQRSIEVELRSLLKSNWRNTGASFETYFEAEFDLEYLTYGDVLNTGRRAAYIPIQPLIGWIIQKNKNGTLKYNGDLSMEGVTSFAYAISRSSSKNPRDAYLPNWNKYIEDNSVYRSFWNYYNRNKAYYVRLFSQDIINNFNKRR